MSNVHLSLRKVRLVPAHYCSWFKSESLPFKQLDSLCLQLCFHVFTSIDAFVTFEHIGVPSRIAWVYTLAMRGGESKSSPYMRGLKKDGKSKRNNPLQVGNMDLLYWIPQLEFDL